MILKAASVPELLLKQQDYINSKAGFLPVFKRFILSDPSQVLELPKEDGAVSYIVQPPVDGSSVALLLYLVAGASICYGPSWTRLKTVDFEQIWRANYISSRPDSASQTEEILESYNESLISEGMSLAENCLRTWFFVHDIDNNYAGMVKARKALFEHYGLTSQTHYIASTGIYGTPCGTPGESQTNLLVQMDAFSMKGKFSQRYLYGSTHLNPTYEYGVTFERGVRVDYGGVAHTIISGTASIDNKGDVVHLGDVYAQSLRMLENVGVLIEEAGSKWESLSHIIVYLRYKEDFSKVVGVFNERFPSVPIVFCHAPVCRPDWLIEMECMLEDPKY